MPKWWRRVIVGSFAEAIISNICYFKVFLETVVHYSAEPSAAMDFFIMWLFFYTYCIVALYVGSLDTQHMNPNYRGSENIQNHRQVRQENRQNTRQNTFSPFLENDEVLTISLWILFYKLSRTKLLINKYKYKWNNIWRPSSTCGQMLTYHDSWIIVYRVTIYIL